MTEPKMQSDPVQRLKWALDRVWDQEFLARYVKELELQRTEEDIFIRLAFEGAGAGGAFKGSDKFVASLYSEWYEPLGADSKAEVRRWWHGKARWEAGQFDDLKARLLKNAFEYH